MAKNGGFVKFTIEEIKGKVKLGDILVLLDHEHPLLQYGDTFKVTGIESKGISYTDKGGNDRGVSNFRKVSFPPIDNKLNRKLYPNRIEKDGYLIPKDKS